MRKFVVTFFPLLVCLLLLVPAPASTIPAGTYSLSNVTVGGSALGGTITLDANGLATSANLMFADATYHSPTFTTIASTGTSGNNPTADFAYISGSNGQVTLYYFNTLNASGGIALCEAGSGCSVASSLQIYSPGYQANLQGGSLTAGAASVSVTPEMSTWTLAMTGMAMIAVVAVLRRRQGVMVDAASA